MKSINEVVNDSVKELSPIRGDDSDIAKANYTPDKSNAKPMDYIFEDFPELEDFTPSDDEVCGYIDYYDINNER